MSIQLKNNASGFLASGVSASDTLITLQSGQGANFPALSSTQFFQATLVSTSGAIEVVKVTGRSGDALTVLRAQEGTSAQSFPALSRIEMRVSAQTIYDVIDSAISSTSLAISNIASVVTVAGNINAVAVTAANVGVIQTVANNIVDVGVVADSIADVNLLADNIADLNTLEDNLADINVVADNIQVIVDNEEAIAAVGGSIANVNIVADNDTEIVAVATNLAGTNTIGTVATNISFVNAVGGAISSVNTVAANVASVNTVSGAIANVNTVATNVANVNAVGSNIANVNTVAGNTANINTVVTNLSDIQTTVANLNAILLADDYAAAAAGSAASALAIYSNTAAQQAAVQAAQAAASVAAGYAASASSVVQQDLSGVNAEALHRSPNAITALFVYDTSKDSDGGAWTEKCQGTSWYNETIYGKWLGAHADATLARTSDATLGSELVVNGDFSNGTTGWTGSSTTLSVVSGALQIDIANGYAIQDITTEIGAQYVYTFDVPYLTSAYVHVGTPASPTALINQQIVARGAQRLTFTASGTTTRLRFQTTFTAGVQLDNISVREVTATTTAADDYFQLTTDGKFYRLNKNLLTNTATLATQTQWLTAGTYTLSSTTASSGSVAVSGAATAGHTAGGAATTFTVATSGNVTFTVTGSVTTAQCELGSSATTYEASGSSRITEVFRGNKRDFPRVAGIVAEASSVNIYDLTEPGRPMWMRFVTGGNAAGSAALIGRIGTTKGSLFSSNGVLVAASTGATAESLQVVSFLKDGALNYSITSGPNYSFLWGGNLAQRNTNQSWIDSKLPNIASSTVNAVAMTVLPDAPINPVTGLAVPTIAVATGGGVSVIKHNGAVVNSSNTNSFNFVYVDPSVLFFSRTGSRHVRYALNPGNLANSFSDSLLGTDGAQYQQNNPTVERFVRRGMLVKASTALGTRVSLKRNHEITPTRGINTELSNQFNTGHQPGDIRRTYLSENTTGSIVGTELVTNGDFTSNLSDWTATNVTWGGAGVADFGTSASLKQLGISAPSKVLRLEISITVQAGTRGRIFFRNFADTNNLFILSGPNPTGYVYAGVSVFYFASDASGFSLNISTESGDEIEVDYVSVKEVIADRSYKAQGATVTGTLTKTEVAAAAELVAYSGFSVSNYAQEPYSADLDFGTGEWSCSAWVKLPSNVTSIPYPTYGSDLLNDALVNDPTGWFGLTANCTISGGVLTKVGNTTHYPYYPFPTNLNAGEIVQVQFDADVNGPVEVYLGHSVGWNTIGRTASGSGTYTLIGVDFDNGYNNYIIFNFGGTLQGSISNLSVKRVRPSALVSRSSGANAAISLETLGGRYLQAVVTDGTTTRAVTYPSLVGTSVTANLPLDSWFKAEACYTTDGTLAIRVNGVEVATTRGNPLLTLNNSSATLTIGNSQALDAPFPGSIALLKLSATVPTPEQSVWMYEQEKQLFRAGAKCCLPDSGNIVDLTYDDATDRWIAVSAANESEWAGLVRTSVTAVPAGSYTKVAAASGIQLQARSSTNPGVDVTIPAYGLREELVRRAEAAARLNKDLVAFDYVGGFTATTVNGNTAITSVANLSYPGSVVGAAVTGSGIPAGATIVAISGTTAYLSAAATASASGVTIDFTDFHLPVGYEAEQVSSAGTAKQEGATKDWTRRFDGFRETIRFGSAPGNTTWVQIQASRSVQ